MLVAVIMSFLVLSFTGVAILDLSHNSMASNLQTSKNIRAQYIYESTINQALWKINSGADALVADSSATLKTSWDDSSQTLTIEVDTMGFEIATELKLDHITPFEHHLSTPGEVQTNGYAYGRANGSRERKFEMLPNVDASFFLANAIAVYEGNQSSWKEEDLLKEGIHVFLGNNLEIDNRIFSNSTLVFIGNDITITNSTISAPSTADSSAALPAIVVINPYDDLTIYGSNTITGTIFATGNIILENATMTGPVIGELITLSEDIEFIDVQNESHFKWTSGFGEEDSYDWDKQVDRWTTTKWEKKRNS